MLQYTAMTSIYDFSATAIDGSSVELAAYRGKVLLIVNVASRCGFTPQYQGLQELFAHFEPRGFAVLGFPCNQFGAQEPGDANEIREYCSLNFNVTFPLFSKIEVNGEGAHPLFKYLKESCPGVLGSTAIKWNFTKFLVDRNGTPVQRIAPTTAPAALIDEIETLLTA